MTKQVATPPDEVRFARAYLLAVAEPPEPAVAAFLEANGPLAAAARIREQDVPAEVANATRQRAGYDAAADLERASQRGWRLIIPEDDEWPEWAIRSLRSVPFSDQAMAVPPALWANGTARLDHAIRADTVTMLGSRAPTTYGEFVAADWAYALANDGVTVVSGTGYGIDAAVHRGALAAEGVTIAIQACGLDAGYPAGHEVLLRKVAERGLVLSEYPPTAAPAKHRFQARARLLATLSCGVVIVETTDRGGSRAVVRAAHALDRPVMAVPGPITSASSNGSPDG